MFNTTLKVFPRPIFIPWLKLLPWLPVACNPGTESALPRSPLSVCFQGLFWALSCHPNPALSLAAVGPSPGALVTDPFPALLMPFVHLGLLA